MAANKPEVFEVYRTRQGTLENVVLLTDYEALQAECDLLRKHLQNLIDQTTPLEPVPGNPMWSRRIQLDEVIAERDQLRAECEKLRKDSGGLVEALESIMGYIPRDVVHCRGDKCRELWCASCFGDEEAESYLVTTARHLKNAKSALAAMQGDKP